MKILLWKIGALGDVVMTTPLLRQLRTVFPAAQIDYLTGRSCAGVIEGSKRINRVIAFDEEILFRARLGALGSIVRLMHGYDVIFILDKHWIFSLLAWAARIPVRVGFSRSWHEGFLHTHTVRYGRVRHEIQYYLDLARAFGLPVDSGDDALELPPPDPVPFVLPERYVVVINSGGANAGEASEVRRMPAALISAVVTACTRDDYVVFVGSADERASYESLRSERTINLCGRATLRQAWAVLARARVVYTTDTGLMHMAAAVNPSVTAVFGPTHPARKCPPGARWVWKDESIYDDAYELRGRIPAAEYFKDMTAYQILHACSDKRQWHDAGRTSFRGTP